MKQLDIANQADVIVAALGEAAEMSGEAAAAAILKYPEVQKDLIESIIENRQTGSVGFIYRKTIGIEMGK